MAEDEDILEIVKGNGGYVGGVYYPPIDEPISDDDIQRTVEEFRKWSRKDRQDEV